MLEIHYNHYCSQNDISLHPLEQSAIFPVVEPAQNQFLCCPYCRNFFKNPVTLPCGHSLCAHCCQELLDRNQRHRHLSSGSYTYALKQNRIRMGVNSLRYQPMSADRPARHRYRTRHGGGSHFSLNSLKKIDETPSTPLAVPIPTCSRFVIRSPQCPSCFAPPSGVAPIQNLTLAMLLDHYGEFKIKNEPYPEIKRNTSPTNSSSSSGFEESEDLHNTSGQNEDFCIQKFNIAILGAQGVGKSRLARTQYLNRLFFGTIEDTKELSEKEDDDSRRSDPELQAKFMIEILDNNNVESDLKDAHGIILAYSISDLESFEKVESLLSDIKEKYQKQVPIVLAATKADLEASKRVVSTEQGEELAKKLGCQFMEVSAKKNEGVNEVFTELVQLIEKHMLEQEVKGVSMLSS